MRVSVSLGPLRFACVWPLARGASASVSVSGRAASAWWFSRTLVSRVCTSCGDAVISSRDEFASGRLVGSSQAFSRLAPPVMCFGVVLCFCRRVSSCFLGSRCCLSCACWSFCSRQTEHVAWCLSLRLQLLVGTHSRLYESTGVALLRCLYLLRSPRIFARPPHPIC